jgi:hypothetical protein
MVISNRLSISLAYGISRTWQLASDELILFHSKASLSLRIEYPFSAHCRCHENSCNQSLLVDGNSLPELLSVTPPLASRTSRCFYWHEAFYEANGSDLYLADVIDSGTVEEFPILDGERLSMNTSCTNADGEEG